MEGVCLEGSITANLAYSLDRNDSAIHAGAKKEGNRGDVRVAQIEPPGGDDTRRGRACGAKED